MSGQEAVSVVSKKVTVSELCCLCTGVSVCYVSCYNIKFLFGFHSGIWYFGLLLIFCIKSSLKTEKGGNIAVLQVRRDMESVPWFNDPFWIKETRMVMEKEVARGIKRRSWKVQTVSLRWLFKKKIIQGLPDPSS